jgi:hypothetical protein
MRKISLCAVAAAMVAIGFGLWNASTGARVVAPPLGQGIDPHQVMMNTKGLLRNLSITHSCSIEQCGN